jgi:hypothetical protein
MVGYGISYENADGVMGDEKVLKQLPIPSNIHHTNIF